LGLASTGLVEDQRRHLWHFDKEYRQRVGERYFHFTASNQPVRKLSLGERMKAELMAALLHHPKVLFLDEPTLGLDVNAKWGTRICEYKQPMGQFF